MGCYARTRLFWGSRMGWLIALLGLAIDIGPFCYGGITKVILSPTKVMYEVVIDGVTTEIAYGLWGEEYLIPRLLGVEGYAGLLHKIGDPAIPVVRMYITSNHRIQVLPASEVEDLPELEHIVHPNQLSMSKARSHHPPSFAFNAAAYTKDEFLPQEAFKVESAGSIRGVRQQLVTLYPYLYRATTGEQRMRRRYRIVVQEEVDPYVDQTGVPEGLAFLVGAKFSDSPALSRYINFKQATGYQVQVAHFAENVSAESVREALREIYLNPTNNLRYAIIVGDHEDIPGFKANHLKKNEALPTDHYYRTLDLDNIVEDINGPDVAVGRFSAEDETQLANMVNKYIRYQSGDFVNQDWLKKASFIGTDDEMYFRIAESTLEFVSRLVGLTWGMSGNFPEPGILGGDRLYAASYQVNGSQVLESLVDGRALVSYSGHGELTYWDEPRIEVTDIEKLGESGALPVILSNSCITGQFSIKESFAESWQRHPYGAAFYWGSVDDSYWHEDDILTRKFFSLATSTSGAGNLGYLTNQALADVYRYFGGASRSRYYWETYVSFGDPTLNMRNDYVRAATISIEDSDLIGTEDIRVKVMDEHERGIANAKVAFSPISGQPIFVGYTDQLGSISISRLRLTLPNAEALRITVSGRNLATNFYMMQVP